MRKLFAALTLTALVAACTDQPTAAVNEVPAPQLLNVANLQARGYTLLWAAEIPEAEAWPGTFRCINGGQGEDVKIWGGPYEFWAKVVETPSGRRMESGYIFLSEGTKEYQQGLTTGDVWTVTGLGWLSKLNFKYAPDGTSWITQPVSATYTNERTGEQVWISAMLHYQSDANGFPIIRNARLLGEYQQCRVVK